jgi:outer membrane protein OmpA-like peptidoglycan-associated protein/flagellar hook assembly protein FlgD
VEYTLTISAEEGEPVKTFEGRRTIQDSFTWNGIDDEGNIVPDGNYSGLIEVLYENGNRPTAATRTFTVDTEYPDVTVTAEHKLFSPNGDGNKDTVIFDHEASTETMWTGTIVSVEGTEILENRWSGRPGEFVWDGTDAAGNTVPDGEYIYTISSEDEAGNRTEERVTGLRLDTRPTNIFLTVDANGLSPNGDGFMDAIGFNTIVNLKEGITEWTLEIVHSSGQVEKRFTGGSETVSRVEWNGVTERGQIREGQYSSRFTVVYAKGNRPTVESKTFFVDITGPDISVTMNPKPFSPDNDGVDDELNIDMTVDELSEVESWSLTILDPTDKPFYTFAGKGTPADRLIWDGLSKEGELVQAAEDYPWTLEARDVFGNISARNGSIPVDVLVIREGDRLKIRISSITFEPNSPRLVIDESETGEKNQRVLERLAEILNKYRNYSIRIEGHAVSVYWYDTARAEEEEVEELAPLSLARADAVKEALIQRGVDAKRITTAGLGGREPVVPHGDLENRWKNRRVEFILIK